MAKNSTKQQTITHEEAVQGANLASGTPSIVTEVKPIPYDYAKLLEEHKTKSGIIRFLDSKDYKRSQIANFMGIKYQFVRNVLITPIKKTA